MRKYKNEFTYNKTLLAVIRDQQKEIDILKKMLDDNLDKTANYYMDKLLGIEPELDEDPFNEYK